MNIFSIYLKHSKKKKYTLKIQWHQVHCDNLRDIIQLKKKKETKRKKQKEKNSQVFETLHDIITPARTDHLQTLGQ